MRPNSWAVPGAASGRISSTSRRAADEMRRLLDQLRGPVAAEQAGEESRPAPPSPVTAASPSPAPLGVDPRVPGICLAEQLEEVRQRLTEAGYTVRISTEGDCETSDAVLAVIIRCLDEVAANVVRHGERTTPVAIMTESLPGPDGGEAGIRLVVLNGVATREPHGLQGGAGLEGFGPRSSPSPETSSPAIPRIPSVPGG